MPPADIPPPDPSSARAFAHLLAQAPVATSALDTAVTGEQVTVAAGVKMG